MDEKCLSNIWISLCFYKIICICLKYVRVLFKFIVCEGIFIDLVVCWFFIGFGGVWFGYMRRLLGKLLCDILVLEVLLGGVVWLSVGFDRFVSLVLVGLLKEGFDILIWESG